MATNNNSGNGTSNLYGTVYNTLKSGKSLSLEAGMSEGIYNRISASIGALFSPHGFFHNPVFVHNTVRIKDVKPGTAGVLQSISVGQDISGVLHSMFKTERFGGVMSDMLQVAEAGHGQDPIKNDITEAILADVIASLTIKSAESAATMKFIRFLMTGSKELVCNEIAKTLAASDLPISYVPVESLIHLLNTPESPTLANDMVIPVSVLAEGGARVDTGKKAWCVGTFIDKYSHPKEAYEDITKQLERPVMGDPSSMFPILCELSLKYPKMLYFITLPLSSSESVKTDLPKYLGKIASNASLLRMVYRYISLYASVVQAGFVDYSVTNISYLAVKSVESVMDTLKDLIGGLDSSIVYVMSSAYMTPKGPDIGDNELEALRKAIVSNSVTALKDTGIHLPSSVYMEWMSGVEGSITNAVKRSFWRSPGSSKGIKGGMIDRKSGEVHPIPEELAAALIEAIATSEVIVSSGEPAPAAAPEVSKPPVKHLH